MSLPEYAFAQVEDSTPPTFTSSGLNNTTGVLRITFSEPINVTLVVPDKIHIRELGSYTGGITLSAVELDTTSDDATISFTLTPSQLATVPGTPELTIEPGAVQDTSGNLIVGTFDASTAVFADATSIESDDNDPRGMAFSNNGTKMFVVGNQKDTIIEYALSPAFDASTAIPTGNFSVVSEEGIPTGMAFSNNGTKMFVVGFHGNITEYTLPTAFNISNAFSASTFSVSSEHAWSSDITFSNDGTKMFVVSMLHNMISEYTLSPAFDISTADFVSPAFSVASEETNPLGMTFSNDGTKMFVVGSEEQAVNEYTLSPAFDISNADFVDATLISSDDIYLSGVAFSNDGAKMFVVEKYGADIYEYTLSSVYPIMVTRTVTVMASNTAPEARAGPNLQVDDGESIRLQGSGSDADNDPLTYLWSQDSRLSFDNSSSATPTVTASSVTADTQIILTLTVDDGTTSVEDMMTLTIRDTTTQNLRPAVNVGPNQTVKEGEQVSMPWTASDPDGDALTYSWSQSPNQPAIFLESPGQSPTTFTTPQVDEDTVFTFTLTVTAGPHNTEDSLTITVKNNHSPTVNAGNNRTVNEGVPVTMSGSASDLDRDPLTYEWTIVSGPQVTLTNSDTLRPQFTAPGVTSDEDIVFRLTVTDDAGESAEDTVTVTVRDVPITISSATYNPGSGTLLITFDQDIDTVDYFRLHVRSAGSDIGGITLSNVVPEPTSSDRTITAVLDSDMRETYADLTSPHLVVEDGAVTDTDGDQILEMLKPIRDASSNKRSSSPPPTVHLSALAQAGIVDIPPHIAKQVALHDGSDPLEPIIPDGTFDFPLVINGYGYLLDDVTNTLVPQTVRAGDDSVAHITFTVYTQKDLAHFTLYLNLSGADTDYTNSDTYITYKDDGTIGVTDPHGYIGSATVTVTQEDDKVPERKIVRITVEFGEEPMDSTNMVAYMWNTDRKAVFIKVIDAFEVTAVLPESVIQTADLEPASELPADPEPVSSDVLRPDDYDEAQVLTLIRMWSGFESESITDAQLLTSLGFDYPDADIPDWVMTELGVLAAKGDVTVDEFMLALQYVLEHA